MKAREKRVQVLDTTLRDGEQTSGVSFTAEEKLAIAKLLLCSVNVDRIEICSAKVSAGELETAGRICAWARQNNLLERIEVLGFVDYNKSVEWLLQAGCKTLNLLCKGSLKHCEQQLGKTQEEHFSDVRKTIECAKQNGLRVNAYLEDWSNGTQYSKQYVFGLVNALLDCNVGKIFLADTLGILSPEKTKEFVAEMIEEFPQAAFEFHAHNDYGLATANCLAAVSAGAKGLHVTVNGLGERAGNAALDEIVSVLNDHSDCKTSVNENALIETSQLVETFSRKRIAFNKPISGENAFVQTAGIHADGDKKAKLYESILSPERFGRQRQYALGKLSGKASIELNLKKLGIELNKEQLDSVVKKVVELGDKKERVSVADLPFVVADVLQKSHKDQITVSDFRVFVEKGKRPKAIVVLKILEKTFSAEAVGDGGYDAFMKAVGKIALQAGIRLAELVDYNVRIPPGGKTDAIVETTINWKQKELEFTTVGIDSDQLAAAIKATEKMLNFVAFSNGESGKV